MVAVMTAIGSIIKWRAMVYSHGLMVDSTKAHTLTTKKKAMETFTGPMAESMKVAGRMESNMELALIPQPAVKPNRANGPRVSVLIGYQATIKGSIDQDLVIIQKIGMQVPPLINE
jgi:hypothetical protein